MVLARDVYVAGHETPQPGVPVGPPVGAPTAWAYGSKSDTVFFTSTGRSLSRLETAPQVCEQEG
jgi:hypothetical protein